MASPRAGGDGHGRPAALEPLGDLDDLLTELRKRLGQFAAAAHHASTALVAAAQLRPAGAPEAKLSNHGVRVAHASERDSVLDSLMLAFSGDPCLRYVLDTPAKLLKGFHAFASAMGGAGLDHGAAWIAEDAAAAALWLPPNVTSDREAMMAVVGELGREEKLPVLGEVGDAMERYHPQEPHWYLAMIGVDPARQGRGYGSAILRDSLRRCDEDGVIAYLESSNPKNVPLYERWGFEVIGFVQPGDFPGIHPMIRQPRALAGSRSQG